MVLGFLNPQRLRNARAKGKSSCSQGCSQPPSHGDSFSHGELRYSSNKSVVGRQQLGLIRLTCDQVTGEQG